MDKKEWRVANPERLKEYARRKKEKRHKEKPPKYFRNNSNKKTPESMRDYHLKRTYNISLDVYNKMFEEQKGCCYVCHTHQSQLKTALAVDHSHETGEVRKLLCHKCNLALGYAKEDVNILQSLINYLKG